MKQIVFAISISVLFSTHASAPERWRECGVKLTGHGRLTIANMDCTIAGGRE